MAIEGIGSKGGFSEISCRSIPSGQCQFRTSNARILTMIGNAESSYCQESPERGRTRYKGIRRTSCSLVKRRSEDSPTP